MLPTELPCLGLNNNSFSGGYYGAKCKNAKTNILRSANYEFGFEHSLKHCFLNYSFFKDVTLIKGILWSDPALALILAALAKQAAEMAPKLCWAWASLAIAVKVLALLKSKNRNSGNTNNRLVQYFGCMLVLYIYFNDLWSVHLTVNLTVHFNQSPSWTIPCTLSLSQTMLGEIL